ncbi:MAG: HNH endonuclease signature motif containing protein [Pseudomonadota bacterium]
MRYWWVNQKQTYKHEFAGGYLWSPQLNKRGRNIRAYDLMRLVNPGDIVFSYADAQIKALGLVSGNCYPFPKPTEFGSTGANWSEVGWKVDVQYNSLSQPLRTKSFIDQLRPLLPAKYSPLQPATGNGNQHSYLYDISEDLALALGQLMGGAELAFIRGNYVLDVKSDRSNAEIEKWEDRVEAQLKVDETLSSTEVDVLVSARRGQGRFRERLFELEKKCRVTGVAELRHLVASHTKPWLNCSNEERLDPENGFMLTPSVDHLFDKGFISFSDDGELLLSPVASLDSLTRMAIPIVRVSNVGSFSEGQKRYLEWHRERLFLADILR